MKNELRDPLDPPAEAASLQFRSWLIGQIEAAGRRSVEDKTKKSREYHWHASLLLEGILTEYDRRSALVPIAVSRPEPEEEKADLTRRDTPGAPQRQPAAAENQKAPDSLLQAAKAVLA